MSVKIPPGYKLEPDTDPKVLRSRKYQAWTTGDLKEMLADYPDDTTVWIGRYDDDADDVLIRPLENFSGCLSDRKGESYVTL